MIGKRRLSLAIALLFLLLRVAPAAAQDLATAEALFNKGVADMEAGSYDVACPAIAESNRLDPRPGTLYTLADCEARAGKIATASARFGDYLRAVSGMTPALKFRHHARARAAEAQKAALAAQIPELRLVFPAAAPPGVRVVRDGAELSAASLGISLPVDPGDHVVTTQVPDGPVVQRTITLSKGEKKTVELVIQIARRDLPKAQAKVSTPSAAPKLEVLPVARPAVDRAVSFWQQHQWSMIAGGAAVGLAGAGAGLGIRTWSHYTDFAATCGGATGCSDADKASLEREAAATNVLFAAAGVAAIISTTFFLFIEPKRHLRQSALTVTHRGHRVHGRTSGPEKKVERLVGTPAAFTMRF
jgi:hypothetical protein